MPFFPFPLVLHDSCWIANWIVSRWSPTVLWFLRSDLVQTWPFGSWRTSGVLSCFLSQSSFLLFPLRVMAALGLTTACINVWNVLNSFSHLTLHPGFVLFLCEYLWTSCLGPLWLPSSSHIGYHVMVPVSFYRPKPLPLRQLPLHACPASDINILILPPAIDIFLLFVQGQRAHIFLTWTQYDALECGEHLFFKCIFPFKKLLIIYLLMFK